MERDERTTAVIIDRGLVKLQETRVLKTMSLPAFMVNLNKNLPTSTGILPSNTVYYSTLNAERSLYVIELQPAKRTIIYTPNKTQYIDFTKPLSHISYDISLPYVYICLSFTRNATNNVRAFVTKSPLSSMEDTIAAAPFPNIHSCLNAGEFCLGEIRVSVDDPMRIRIKNMVNELFFSTFNDDLSIMFPRDVYKRASESFKQLRFNDHSNTAQLYNADIYPDIQSNDLTPYLFRIWEELSTHDMSGLNMSYRKINTFGAFINSVLQVEKLKNIYSSGEEDAWL